MTDCILSGTLSLGQELSWQGENVFSDFCLYSDETTESSPIVDIDFQLDAITDYTAIKLFMFQRHRWKAGIVESIHNGIHSFLKNLFDQGTNISGITKKALIISVVKLQENLPALNIGSKLVIYGEKMDSKLFVFVHPVYATTDFLPIYESSTFHPNHNQSIYQPILNELSLNDEEELVSSAQIIQPTNIKNEFELMDALTVENNSDRDLIKEFKSVAEERKKSFKEKKMQQQQSIRLSKSKPTKYSNTKSTLEEKKNTVKKLIKEALSGASKEDKSINQLIYSSIRYTCRHQFTSSKPLDETKLQCIIKLHTDFYNNLDTIVNIFHPPANDNDL